MSGEHDYTKGDDIPASALKAEDLVMDGDAVIDHDADQSEASNSFDDLAPGHYRLKVVGFGDPKKVLKKTYLNGQAHTYESYQVDVKFASLSAGGGRIRSNFLLIPSGKEAVMLYNHGTNDKGKAEGFQAQIFGHFITRLIPGSYEKGKPLAPIARSLKNWIGREVWATVENGQASEKVDPKTGEPYPPRPQIKPFSFRQVNPGESCPLGNEGPTPPGEKTKAKPEAKAPAGAAMAGVGAGVNGSGHAADNGLDDI